MTDVVLLEVRDRIATVTLNRPEARNALSVDVLRALPRVMVEADGRDDVDVLVLTGADPAFCAGLDLKELGATGGPLRAGDAGAGRGPFPTVTKPVIGAVNGAAVTGGFEIALNCDLLVASERARFADTHARVGLQPAWGLSVLLPQAVGVRRAREMSATGNFVDASTALDWGLVNHVVAHADLLAFARSLAGDIVSNDQAALRRLLATYNEGVDDQLGHGWVREQWVAGEWQGGEGLDPAEIERRRQGILVRGRAQTT